MLNDIYRFIESALVKGESVLVHSVKGQNRSCCVLAAYLMKKYKWTLYKTLEYLHSRKPNLEIRANFFSQLQNLENRLAKLGHGAKTSTWNEISDDPKNIESEELLLTNTFLNAKKPPPVESNGGSSPKKGKGDGFDSNGIDKLYRFWQTQSEFFRADFRAAPSEREEVYWYVPSK